MEHATDHITSCVKYAERCQDDPDGYCFDPGDEWARLQREGDGEPAGEAGRSLSLRPPGGPQGPGQAARGYPGRQGGRAGQAR